MHPPTPAEIMHELQKSSEDEVTKKRIQEPAISQITLATENPQPHNTGVKTGRALALENKMRISS